MNGKKGKGGAPYGYLEKPSGGRSSTGVIVVGAVIAVVLIALVVALVVTSGEATEDTAVQQVAPVVVQGDPLPEYPQMTTSYVADPATDPAVGIAAPQIIGEDFEANEVVIDPGDGDAHVIVFAAHWCPHCQQEVPLIADWIAEGNLPDGVQVSLVSTAVRQGSSQYPPSRWLQSADWENTVVLDNPNSGALAAYGAGSFPYIVYVDADGNVAARSSGALPIDDFAAVVDTIAP